MIEPGILNTELQESLPDQVLLTLTEAGRHGLEMPSPLWTQVQDFAAQSAALRKHADEHLEMHWRPAATRLPPE